MVTLEPQLIQELTMTPAAPLIRDLTLLKCA